LLVAFCLLPYTSMMRDGGLLKRPVGRWDAIAVHRRTGLRLLRSIQTPAGGKVFHLRPRSESADDPGGLAAPVYFVYRFHINQPGVCTLCTGFTSISPACVLCVPLVRKSSSGEYRCCKKRLSVSTASIASAGGPVLSGGPFSCWPGPTRWNAAISRRPTELRHSSL
jgi:hypothetical protein